jgi:hypothetical protein
MSTNNIVKSNDFQPIIYQKPITESQQATKDESIDENSSQKNIVDLLVFLSRGSDLNTRSHVLLIQILFNVLAATATEERIYKPDFHKAVFAIFDSIRKLQNSDSSDTDSIKKEIKSKIDDFFSKIPKDSYDKNEILLEYAKKVLSDAKLEDLISPINHFIELEDYKKNNIIKNYQNSYLTLKLLLASFNLIHRSLNEDIISNTSDFYNKTSSELKGKKLLEYFLGSLTTKFLKTSEFSSDQIHDLLSFFMDIVDSYQTKNNEIKKVFNFYSKKINSLFSKIDSYLFESESLTQEFLNKNNLNTKELFYYLNEIKKCRNEMESFKIESNLTFLIFYFFYITEPNELKEIFNENKNYTSFCRSLKRKLISLLNKIENDRKLGRMPEKYLECFSKDKVINQFRNMMTLLIQSNNALCSAIDTFYFLENQSMEFSFNEFSKKNYSHNYVRNLQITQSNSEGEKTQEAQAITSSVAIQEQVPAPTPLPKSEERKEEISESKKKEDLQKQLALNTNTILFSGKFTKEHFDNAQWYLSNLITLLNRFLRVSHGPIARESISALILNIGINGTLGLEQMYSAIIAERKKCKTSSELKKYLSHDLLHLYENCGFSTEGPTENDIELFMNSNKLEIFSRNALQHIGNYNPERHGSVKKLLEDAYLLSINDPKVDIQSLLINSFDYCQDVIYSMLSLRTFVSAPISDEKLDEVEEELKNFSTSFKNACSNLKLVENSQPKILPDFEMFLEQNHPVSLSAQSNLANLRFLTALHKAEVNSFSEEHPEEIALISPRVLYLNQLILESFFNLILEVQRKNPETSDSDLHQLDKLLEKTGYELNLNQREKEFLQKGKEVRHMTRYEPVQLKKKSTAANRAKELRSNLERDCAILNNIIKKLTTHAKFKEHFNLK